MTTPPTSSSTDGSKFAVSSGVLVETQSFTWTIQNFDIVRKSDKMISAQSFEFEAGHSIGLPTSWKLYLGHCERGEPKAKWISISVKILETTDNKPAAFTLRIYCKRMNGSRCFNTYEPFIEIDMAGNRWRWAWRQYIKRDENDLPLVDGSLIIEVEFSLYATKSPVKVLNIPSQVKAFEARALQKLSQDFGQILTETGSKLDSVTKLVSVDKVEFPVNRGILAARSRVFQRMFQSGMKETKTGLVHIDDLSGKTLAVLLHYMTTGTLHEDWNSADVILELPYAAQKYELGLLVDFLDQVLGRICTIGNAKQLALLATKLGMKKVESDLLAFIKEKAAGAKSLEDLTTLMDADTTN